MKLGNERQQARLTAALAAAGVPWDDVADCRELGGGTFNTVVRVQRTDGTGLVVKLAPDETVPVLRYERGILDTEAWYYRTARDATRVPLPDVLAAGAQDGAAPGDHLVMSECPGTPWFELLGTMDASARARLRTALGGHVAALHTITGNEGFGYPARPLGPLRATWRAAFLEMVDAVLDDAGRFDVTLPRPTDEIRALFAAQSPVLDEVTVPRLVHFDLWDGNILVDQGPDGPRIGALIDAERAFWGDPVAELVSLGLFHDIERDEAFLNGYRAAGGSVVFDASTRTRLALYRAYLHLIMWVEAVPRQFDAQHRAWLEREALKPLAATFDDWSGRKEAKTA
ncbi:aminoglycoside phosphotransferase family protein [Streptomyces sp. S.PNR 29]|uniref:phosphotransferase family protein n=1 Tax=Streptomyces sp. S.PNR 29 TaxID=2973805 RepID=UPI0025AFBBD4|nr:aminoglycoside phosphotransferase family protein [Streptomyces sp. S.PNR 29]MDN0201114.1 aminoglycoside phosphotransferase family protein [Streptomyces sp. S.PNR 29]